MCPRTLFIIDSTILIKQQPIFSRLKIVWNVMLVWVCSCLQLSEKWIKILPSYTERREIRYRSEWAYVLRHRKVPACATSAENDVVWQVITKTIPECFRIAVSGHIGISSLQWTLAEDMSLASDSYLRNNSFFKECPWAGYLTYSVWKITSE